MTVGELITELVKVNHHEYDIDVRVTPRLDADYVGEDRDVLGIISVIESHQAGAFAAKGWVTLEVEP